jgi:hypothetical protein
MQNTLAEVVLSLGPVDVDNGGILQPVAEETNHALVRVVLQRMEGFVDHYPARLAHLLHWRHVRSASRIQHLTPAIVIWVNGIDRLTVSF